ncbi:type IV secretion system protein VirB1 [Bartonella callosciuri]|uniref:Type IV secretion system protein VirB1 n=1 Tax=Bartonella callosciuri TaxID=686223 RepID=A0A840NWD8_9HYPH|nr:trwN protein [Bartonella callosciuri]MBB5074243.1 type IV secretion system protein VirB1 [Bartonella callosciuri]
MTISDFIMLAVAHITVTNPATLPIAIIQELRDNIGAISVNDNQKLSCQPSTFGKTIAKTKQPKQSSYNFDTNLGQTSVENLKLFSLSLSSENDPYKNFGVVQTFSEQCNKRITSKYSSEQTALRTVLSFYNTENFKNDFTNAYVQNIASHVGTTTSAHENERSQKPVQLHAREPERTTNTEPLLIFPEELADVFTHKAGGVHDAFTAEGALHWEGSRSNDSPSTD